MQDSNEHSGEHLESLIQHNIRLLAPHMRPSLVKRLSEEPPLNVKAINPGTAEANMTVEGKPVYVPDAPTFCREQVEAYCQSPTRYNYDINSLHSFDNTGTGEDEISVSIIRKLNEAVTDDLSNKPREDNFAGYLICLGLGLGLHLPDLVTQTQFRDLIIYDPCLDTLRCSLHSLDWELVVKTVEQRGGRIKFVFELDADLATRAIMAFLREENFTLIEGTYIYRHYPLVGINEVLGKLVELSQDLIIYNGWLEDEMIHFRNGMRNFLYRDMYLLNERINDPAKLPAFIIGSGPSLEKDIERIRELADQAVIFSCGSSIRILLSHGIKPDFHCELENVFNTVPVIAEVAGKFDLSGITLITSATVQPAVLDFFDNHIVFFREGGGAVRWLQQDKIQFDHASPSCTNVGARTAIQMGFQELYLFGIDLGSVQADRHHASGSIYNAADEAGISDRVDEMGLQIETYPLTTEGNFRDVVHTSPLMLFMKNSFELLALNYPEIRIFNCSDGARITATHPKKSSDIPSRPSQSKAGWIRSLCKKLLFLPKGSYIQKDYILKLEHSLEDWNQRFQEICTDPNLTDFLSLHDEMRTLCDYRLPDGSEDQFDRATRIIMSGSLQKILHFIRFVDCRLAATQRETSLNRLKKILLSSLPDIKKRQIHVVQSLRKRVEAAHWDELADIAFMSKDELIGICRELEYVEDFEKLGSCLEHALTLKGETGQLAKALFDSYFYQDKVSLLEKRLGSISPAKNNSELITALTAFISNQV